VRPRVDAIGHASILRTPFWSPPSQLRTFLCSLTRLDYNELYRDLQDIFVISQKGIDFDSTLLRTATDSVKGS
jgi:hypothetical protein